MRKTVLTEIARPILLQLAAIFIILVFSAAGAPIQGNSDSAFYPGSACLIADDQGDDPGSDERGSRLLLSDGIIPHQGDVWLVSRYYLRKEVKLQALPLCVSSHLNRAPPL